MGFLQDNGSPGSGFVQVEALAHQICCDLPNARVNLFPWNVDTEAIAEWYWRYRPTNRPQVHLVGGYSYGATTAINFMNGLLKRSDPNEIQVRVFGSCDGVVRWKLLPGVAGATGLGKLKVPVNVDEVFWYKQENPRWGFRSEPFQPAGHDLIDSPARAKFTKHHDFLSRETPKVWHPKPIPKPIIRNSHHSYIDNDISFRQTIIGKTIELADECRELWEQEKPKYGLN